MEEEKVFFRFSLYNCFSTQIVVLRDELHSAEIWDALKAATEADVETAKTIVEAAGIIVETADMSICYDELGKMEFKIYNSFILVRVYYKSFGGSCFPFLTFSYASFIEQICPHLTLKL